MWLFSKSGFVSAVAHRDDKDTLVVRARIKEDLEPFSNDIIENEGSDYRYRAFISKEDFKSVVSKQIDEIGYTNFKSEIHKVDEDRADAYLDIWSVMVRFAEDKYWLLANKKIKPRSK